MSAAKIHVRFQHAGFHCWPDAPPHRAYLRDPHRHLFKVEVSTWVRHDERDIEFHDLQEQAADWFANSFNEGEAGGRSCETMARSLGERLCAHYEHRRVFEVTVWEDGECGATVLVGRPPA